MEEKRNQALKSQLESTLKYLKETECEDDIKMLEMLTANYAAIVTESEILGIQSINKTMVDFFSKRDGYLRARLGGVKDE